MKISLILVSFIISNLAFSMQPLKRSHTNHPIVLGVSLMPSLLRVLAIFLQQQGYGIYQVGQTWIWSNEESHERGDRELALHQVSDTIHINDIQQLISDASKKISPEEMASLISKAESEAIQETTQPQSYSIYTVHSILGSESHIFPNPSSEELKSSSNPNSSDSSSEETEKKQNTKCTKLRIQAKKSFAPKKNDRTTSYTPKKGETICVSVGTPLRELVGGVKASVENRCGLVVESKNKKYDSRTVINLNPMCARDSFAINADHSIVFSLAEEFLATYIPKGKIRFEHLLIRLSEFLNRNINIIDTIIIRTEFLEDGVEEGPVCRHFATCSAILFSKIMSLRKIDPSEWGIQVLSCCVFDSDWEFVEGSHAWNLITFKENERVTYWFFDSYNFAFVKLDLSVEIADLNVIEFESGTIEKTPLNESDFFEKYVLMTFEKCFNQNSDSSLYSEINRPVLLQIASNSVAGYRERLTKRLILIKRPIADTTLDDSESD